MRGLDGLQGISDEKNDQNQQFDVIKSKCCIHFEIRSKVSNKAKVQFSYCNTTVSYSTASLRKNA